MSPKFPLTGDVVVDESLLAFAKQMAGWGSSTVTDQRVIPISDYFGGGGADGDMSVALAAAIAAIPDNDATWYTDNTYTQNGAIIFFPSRTGSDAYRFDSKVTIPGTKNVLIWGENSRFLWNGVGDYMFRVNGSYNNWGFNYVIFDGAGVEVAAGNQRASRFDNCVFVNSADYAIATLGDDVNDMKILDCEFARTAGGILIAGTAKLWAVQRCVFSRLSQPGVAITGTGETSIMIDDNDFEIKQPVAAQTTGWIQTVSGTDVRIRCNRFGGELANGGVDGGPPKNMIVCGPDVGSADGTIDTLVVEGNHFHGRNGGATAASADCAVYLGKAVRFSRIVNNTFQAHNSALVVEDYGVGDPRDCVWAANAWDSLNHVAPIFSGANTGWYIVEPPNI